MNTTTLQIPLSKTLKNEAKKVALEQGFSSLQEYVRILLMKLSAREFAVSIEEEPTVKLSKRAIRRYNRMIDDIRHNRNITFAANPQDFLKKLNS